MGENVLYLWGAGCLVALFGIWYTLYSRLPRGEAGEKQGKRLSKQEKAAQSEERMLEKLLAKRGISLPAAEEEEPVPRVSPKANVLPASESTADRIRAKYTKKVV